MLANISLVAFTEKKRREIFGVPVTPLNSRVRKQVDFKASF
jgi:hypothetical protein